MVDWFIDHISIQFFSKKFALSDEKVHFSNPGDTFFSKLFQYSV
jgi:hypothetical protein